MPPKQPAKPLRSIKPAAPKPGPKRKQYTLFQRVLTNDQKDVIFCAYNRYHHVGRPLLHEEICGIIGIWLGKEPQPGDVARLLKAFDDSEHPTTKKHDVSSNDKGNDLEKKVDGFFSTYLERNIEARARAEILKGL